MMWKLTLFELKKAAGGKFFRIAVCLLLVLNFLLLGGLKEWRNLQTSLSDGTMMEEFRAEFEKESFWSFYANVRRATVEMGTQYDALADLTSEEETAFENAMREKYGADVLENMLLLPTAKMQELPGYLGETQSDYTSISNYQFVKLWNTESQAAYEKVIENAKILGREALKNGDDYGVRRNLEIIRRYSLTREKITSPVCGWNEFLFETPTMLLVFLLILLGSAGSFAGERDEQMWILLHTAKNGKGKTLIAKYLAGSILAVGLTVLFQLVSLFAIWFKGGLLGASQPVNALEQLDVCPYTYTVWQYALVSLGCFIFAAVMLSAFLQTISALSKSRVIAYTAGAVFLGGSVAALYVPQRNEWLTGVLALAKPVRFFDSFYAADLFGFPVLWVVVLMVVWTALAAGSILLGQKVYHRKRRTV